MHMGAHYSRSRTSAFVIQDFLLCDTSTFRWNFGWCIDLIFFFFMIFRHHSEVFYPLLLAVLVFGVSSPYFPDFAISVLAHISILTIKLCFSIFDIWYINQSVSGDFDIWAWFYYIYFISHDGYHKAHLQWVCVANDYNRLLDIA